MLRPAIAIIIVGTLIGAVLPARREAKGPPNAASAAHRPVKTDWGSAAEPLAGTPSAEPIQLYRRSDGHFYADAQVNQTTVHFLVDTGASGVALSSADAQKANVPMSGPSEPVGRGASGVVMGQQIRLDRLQLGPQQVHDVDAIVMEGGEQSLLGQSFLSGYTSIEISGDVMTLR
jgi:aspartyl protease family protein